MDFSDFFNYQNEAPPRQEADIVFLADLPAAEWEQILACMPCFRYAAGDVVVRQGDVSRAFYLVVDGQLEVVHIDASGNETPFYRIGPLSVFGEQAFLDGCARSATVRALTGSEVRMMTLDDFNNLVPRNPDLTHRLLFELGRIVSLRLREMTALAMTGNG